MSFWGRIVFSMGLLGYVILWATGCGPMQSQLQSSENFKPSSGAPVDLKASDFVATGPGYSLDESSQLFSFETTNGKTRVFTSSEADNIHTHYGKGQGLSNYIFSGSLRFTNDAAKAGVTFLSGYPANDRYYALVRHSGNKEMRMLNRGGNACHGLTTGITTEPNTWYSYKVVNQVKLNSTTIQIKFWPSFETEPFAPQIECEDSTPTRLTAGTIGLAAGGSGVKMWSNLSMSFNPFESDSGTDPTPTPDPGPGDSVIPVPVISVNASSEQSPNVAKNAVDGQMITRWSAQGQGETLDLNFDGAYKIQRVEISIYKGDSQDNSFALQLFSDGRLLQPQSFNSNIHPQQTEELLPYSLRSNVEATALRFIGNGNTSSDWNSIQEIRVYGVKVSNATRAIPTEVVPSSPTPAPAPAPEPTPIPTPQPPPGPGVITQCNDGIDNDGDGLVDWQQDLGCFGAGDNTERALTRNQEQGWSTFDLPAGSKIIYVSSRSGNDSNNGRSPATAVRTINRGAALITDGSADFLLLKRGETFRTTGLARFKSGQSFDRPILISSYGTSTQRPRVEIQGTFLNDNGRVRRNLAVVGLELVAATKIPGDSRFTGSGGQAFRYVASGSGNLLFEDNVLRFSNMTLQSLNRVEIRRNVIYKAYNTNTCTYNADGSRNKNGSHSRRIQGIFSSGTRDFLLEENLIDHNGWNRDIQSACASIFSQNLYFVNMTNMRVLNNLVTRASSLGMKLRSNRDSGMNGVEVRGNVFFEGELGIAAGGDRSDTSTAPHKHANLNITNNILTDIGRSRPTDRGLSWYLDFNGVRDSRIQQNLLINMPSIGNSFGIRLKGSMMNIDVTGNNLHSINRPFVDQTTSRQNVRTNITNQSSPASARNPDTYARSIGVGSNMEALSQAMQRNSRYNYKSNLNPRSVFEYIKAGY